MDEITGVIRNPDNPPRLEMEILGHGWGYRTWSITYKIFIGDVRDAFAGAWDDLYKWAGDSWQRMCYKTDSGVPFYPEQVFIDSGDGLHVDPVYHFAARWTRTLPSKGFKQIIVDPERRELGIAGTEILPYRVKRLENGVPLVEINTQFYKRGFYATLNRIKRAQLGEQPPGYCDFPDGYAEVDFKEYSAQLASEEQLADGSFKKIRERNEALDCHIGCLCAAHFFLDRRVEELKDWGRKQGATEQQCKEIDSSRVLTALEARLRPR
jgi:phage terminase large subunit GpA-like protein